MAFMKFKERSAKHFVRFGVVTASALLGTAAAAAERYRDLQPPVTTQTSEPVHVVIDKTAADYARSTAEQTEKASESLGELAATVRARESDRENPLRSEDFDIGRRVAYPAYSERPNGSFKCTIPRTSACRTFNENARTNYLTHRREQIAIVLHKIKAETPDEQWAADRVKLFEAGMLTSAPREYHDDIRATIARER